MDKLPRLFFFLVYIHFLLHIPRVVLLFVAQTHVKPEAKADSVDRYLKFISDEWSSGLITGIYLQEPSDKQKSCQDSLFMRKWHGTHSYRYADYSKPITLPMKKRGEKVAYSNAPGLGPL